MVHPYSSRAFGLPEDEVDAPLLFTPPSSPDHSPERAPSPLWPALESYPIPSRISLWDPDAPALDERPAAAQATAVDPWQRNVAHMRPAHQQVFQALRAVPMTRLGRLDRSHATEDLHRLFEIPQHLLAGSSLMRVYRVFVHEVSVRGERLLADLTSPGAREAADAQLGGLSSAHRACALAAVLWATASGRAPAPQGNAFRFLLRVFERDRALGPEVERHLQALECRHRGRALIPDLEVPGSRQAQARRPAEGFHCLAAALGLP